MTVPRLWVEEPNSEPQHIHHARGQCLDMIEVIQATVQARRHFNYQGLFDKDDNRRALYAIIDKLLVADIDIALVDLQKRLTHLTTNFLDAGK